MRPSWQETWLELASNVALRSLCSRRQHGAVIVSMDQRVIGTGYNGPPAGFPHEGEPCIRWCDRGLRGPTSETVGTYDDCPSLHAEANALLNVGAPHLLPRASMYVNGASCFNCAKLIANSGIIKLYMLQRFTEEYRRPAEVIDFLEQCGVSVYLIR